MVLTQEKIKFRPRARLIYILGSDLIKDEMAGILELVKNSYDADANEVELSFVNLDERGKATICIKDDGHGMSRETLLGSWMSPATDNKGKRKISPGGRPMLGRKGVGRFSAMRLGTGVTIDTVPGRAAPSVQEKELRTRYQIKLKWDDFDETDEFLDEIEQILRIESVNEDYEQGTQLELTGLRDRWDRKRLEKLYRELKILLSPIPTEHQKKFGIWIYLDQSGLPPDAIRKFSGKMEPYDIPDFADYYGHAQIEANGSFDFSYERYLWKARDKHEITKTENGKDIRIRYPDLFDFLERPDEPLPCGPINVKFYIWDRDIDLLKMKDEKKPEVERMGVRAMRRMLDELSGVAIYRDGFGVRPFGDKDFDWLNLGQRRVQKPVQSIGPNQLFGFVEISSIKNPDLDDKASREGLKENDAYLALQDCILGFLSWVETPRDQFRRKHGLGRPQLGSTRALIDERKDAFLKLKSSVSNLVQDDRERTKVIRLLDKAERSADREHERFNEQTRLLHDNHALGLLARFVLHEGDNLAGALEAGISIITRELNKGRDKELIRILLEEDSVIEIDSALTASSNSVDRLFNMLSQLDPLTRPRRKRRSVWVVESVLESAISVLGPRFQSWGIEVKMSKGSHQALIWEADLFHAAFNLLDNSIYWLASEPEGQRRIEIMVTEEPEEAVGQFYVSIVISDNGKGINHQAALSIFDLGYTEKPNGKGAGLFIAREAIERSGGSIDLANPGEKGAQFVIKLQGR